MAKTLVYQLYPISFKRGLKDLIKHLDRIVDLGVDYVWLSPIYPSPRFDHGYDVEDYLRIDRRIGKMEDFDRFVEKAHNLGIGVLMDLVLNHTSTFHEWFKTKPEYYYWSDSPRHGWKNLFNGGSAWQCDEDRRKFYLHLFHSRQADLKWFIEDELNWELVDEFREIVDFWLDGHCVDGFRLDVPQGINKDLDRESVDFYDLLDGERSIEVINAVFDNKHAFLVMECFDPTFGEIVDMYTKRTEVNFFLNAMIKDAISESVDWFEQCVRRSATQPRLMLDLESHDSPRFPSRGVGPEYALECLFGSKAEGICLFQGQELGLKNPPQKILTNQDLISLDAQTIMRYMLGEDLEKLRVSSRSNARVPLPFKEYDEQRLDPNSYYHLTVDWIKRWRADKLTNPRH